MTIRIPDATTPATGTTLPEEPGLADFLPADVSSMPRQYVAVSSGALTSGNVYAARARVRKTRTYSKIRVFTGATAPSGLTDVRFGVWNDTASSKLAETANVVATVVAATTIYTVDLAAGVRLYAGQDVYIGGGFLGTTPPTIRGVALPSSAFSALPPVLAKQTTGWAGGALPSSLGSTSGACFWAELLP